MNFLRILLNSIFGNIKLPEVEPIDTNPYHVKNDILYKDNVRVRFEPTSKISSYGMIGPRFLIQHYTANNSLEGTINVFKNYSVSAHLVIDRDGTIVQMVPFDRVAWHCGKSYTTSKWGTDYTSLNKYSIGLEFVNYGYYANHVKKDIDPNDWTLAKHKNESARRKWQPYTDAQIETAVLVNAALAEHYDIPLEHIKGHDDISPDRKVDPGPAFPMDEIKSRIGEL